eukprot:2522227-Prorocentrum_lima.AAC.1
MYAAKPPGEAETGDIGEDWYQIQIPEPVQEHSVVVAKTTQVGPDVIELLKFAYGQGLAAGMSQAK